MTKNDANRIGELLSSPKKVVITTHQRPDGDAMGSSLGLYHYLVKKGHDVQVITPTDYPENLKWMPGTASVWIGPEDEQKAATSINAADAVFCLDFNALSRINEFGEMVKESAATKIMIDHHMHPDGFEDLAYWDDDASSTAELIYRLVAELGEKDKVDADIATCLYAGILTDTGSFRFPATTPEVHRTVAHLMEAGAKHNEIHELIFANDTEKRLRLIGHSLSNRLTILPEYHTSYICLNAADTAQFNIGSGDTEGIVNYNLGMKGINFGVLMIHHEDKVKMSFRSRGSFPANEFAAHFNGGGHYNAAGGRSHDTIEETEKRFLLLLEQYKDQLDY